MMEQFIAPHGIDKNQQAMQVFRTVLAIPDSRNKALLRDGKGQALNMHAPSDPCRPGPDSTQQGQTLSLSLQAPKSSLVAVQKIWPGE